VLNEAAVEDQKEHGAEEGEEEAAAGADQDPRDDPADNRPTDPERGRRPDRHRVRARHRKPREPADDEAPDEQDDDEEEESQALSLTTRPERPLARASRRGDDRSIEPRISHQDVTTIMRIVGDIQEDVHEIRTLLEDEDGEEEAPEDDS
jgi:hypothetical protein